MSDDDTRLNKGLETVEEVLASIADKFCQRFDGIELALSAPQEPLFVPMDAILAERREDCAVFSVRDNNGGIADDVLPNIFSPAPHSNKAHTADNCRNMGIGLSVCSIMKAADNDYDTTSARIGSETITRFYGAIWRISAGKLRRIPPSRSISLPRLAYGKTFSCKPRK